MATTGLPQTGGYAPVPPVPDEAPARAPPGARGLRHLLSIYAGFRGGARRLLVASFLMTLAGGMTNFVLILFMYELTSDLPLVTKVMSLSTWTAVAFFLPGGMLVDRLDRRVTLALSLLLSAAGMSVFSIAPGLPVIAVGQVLMGMSFSISFPTLTALMSEKTSDVRRKYLFSMQSFVNMMGIATATVLAGALTVLLHDWFSMGLESSYRVMFVMSALGHVCSILIALTLRPGEEDRENKDESLPSMFSDGGGDAATSRRSLRFVAKYYTPMTIIGFGAGWVVPFFQLYYLLKFQVDVAQIAWLFAATQVSMGMSFFLIPALAERRGSVGAVTGTWGAATATLAAIPLAPTFLAAAPLHLVRMALMNASSPISDSLMMGAVRPRDRGKAAGLTRFMWTAMNAVGQTFTGDLMEWNLDSPFIITVTCYIVATVLFWKWFRKLKEM